MADGDGLDNLLNEIGMGRWQTLGLIANFLIWIVLSPHTIGTTLLNAPVPFKCLTQEIPEDSTRNLLIEESLAIKVNPNETYYDSICPNSFHQWGNESVNFTAVFDPLAQPLLPNCPFVIYDDAIFESTVTTEWHLVCDDSLKRPLFQNTYTIGLIVGCFIGGDIGDRLGRARAVLVGSIIHTVGTLVVAFTTNFVFLLIGRFLCGVTNLMILVTVVTLSLETCPEKYRGPIGMGVGLPYSIGVIVFAGLGIFLRNWRHLYIATSFPALLLVPVAWLLDESPRWLLQVGELEKATKIMEKAAMTNRCSFESKDKIALILQEVMQKEQKLSEKEKSSGPKSCIEKFKLLTSSFFTSLATPAMRKISIISPTVWFLNEVVYYGTIFNANRFSSDNPFLYVALTGVADGLAILLGTVGCYFGRRMTIAGSQFISGILLLLVLVIPDELKWLQWIFVMTGFLMCACASQALFVYTPELFPTVMRARGFAFSNLTGYTGTFVAPFIPDVLAPIAWWITNAILGSIGFITCSMVLTLPETRHVPLCETIQDVEDRAISIQNKKDQKLKDDEVRKIDKAIKRRTKTDVSDLEENNENATNSIVMSVREGIDNPALEKDF